MMREEAIERIGEQYKVCKEFYHLSANPEKDYPGVMSYMEALAVAITALRPVSREQVERMRGQWQWYKPCRESPEKWWGICSTCGHKQLLGEGEVNFCPSCGAPMTDEAVQMVMERLEALKDGKGD